MPEIGVPLGFLIGFITAYVFLLLIRTAFILKEKPIKNLLALIAEILAMPTFWFGGPWITTKFLKATEPDQILPTYILSLAIVFGIAITYPLIRLIIRIGNEFGRE